MQISSIIGSTPLEITEQQNSNVTKKFNLCFSDFAKRLMGTYLEEDIDDLKQELADEGEIVVFLRKGVTDKVKVIDYFKEDVI